MGDFGSIGECSSCGENIELSDLTPGHQVQLALANLIEVVGLMDMVISQPSHEDALRGWKERCDAIVEWAAAQTYELNEFGSAFDSDAIIGDDDSEV